MKVLKLSLLLVAALGLFSCEKENENDNIKTADWAKEIAGTYYGYSAVAFQYVTIPIEKGDETLVITAESENTVTVTFESTTTNTPVFTIKGATVEYDNGRSGYMIQGTGTAVMGHAGNDEKTYDTTLSGIVMKNGTSKLAFSCPAVMGGMTVTFTEGSLPQSEEE